MGQKLKHMAELLYNTPITLPGELATPFQIGTFPMLQHIRDEVQKVVHQMISYHVKAKNHSPDSQQPAKFFLVPTGTHTVHLCSVYMKDLTECFYACTKTFVLDKSGKEEHVSIHPLKQAHVDLESAIMDKPPKPRGRPKKEIEFPLTCQAHIMLQVCLGGIV